MHLDHLTVRTYQINGQSLTALKAAGHGFVMKIGDFGMSRHVALAKGPDSTPHLLRQLTSGVIGTTAYAAPELLDGQSYTEGQALTSATVDLILKSDVYRSFFKNLISSSAAL